MIKQHSSSEGLVCQGLSAGWGDTQVLSGVSFRIPAGETLAVLGRNGVGKSTLISTIVGRAKFKGGVLSFGGKPLERLSTYVRAQFGIGLVPQEREIFPSLSVEENLTVAGRRRGGDNEWTLERVYDLFPRLKERRSNGGNQLSGGEQQMLSIGRALMGNPSLLLMDEPMEGLAPVIVEQIVHAVHRIRRETALTILLVEQHVDIALEMTSRVIVLDRGAIVYDNSEAQRTPDRKEIEDLISVAA
jgi:branched-chain amino acid transport system ATP-binding protein